MAVDVIVISLDDHVRNRWSFVRTNERVYLPMNGVNNDWLPVEGLEAEAHQSWPPKKMKRN